jgi:hypothetical protein
LHGIKSNEVIVLIPYIGPELIATILGRESSDVLDLRMDSKSAIENSLPAPPMSVPTEALEKEGRTKANVRGKNIGHRINSAINSLVGFLNLHYQKRSLLKG